MRWLVIGVLALWSGSAAAEFVVDDPVIVSACRQETTWKGIATCLAKHGRPVIVRDLGTAKLVRQFVKAGDGKEYDTGAYLYVEDGATWHIGGMYEGGLDYDILDLQQVTLNAHTGWRMEIARSAVSGVSLDGETSVPSLLVQRITEFCQGKSYGCAEVMTSCDLLLQGRALWSFRGTMSIKGDTVTVAGNRAIAGQTCSAGESYTLGWN